MFLDTVLARNPRLVAFATELHEAGAIPPDSYVLDLDAVESNAALLAAEAGRLGLRLWPVVKQVGRNPELIRAVARHLPAFAAIDAPEARTLCAAGARAGNLGHLVQIPFRALPELLAWRPEAVTVYDLANARAVSDAARRLGLVQDILVRVEGVPGSVHPGQEGGVPVASLDAFAAAAARLPGVRVAGVTAFPCLACAPDTGRPLPAPNLQLACEARELLASRAGVAAARLTLSAPGVTSMASLPLLARLGATHGEPGHALTGTTPLHAVDPRQPERPAYVYVSEVAHLLADGRPALFGGGFYPRASIRSALIPRTGARLAVRAAPAANIDYYRLLEPGDARPGDTAVLAFRTQVFTTRSTVAVVSGLDGGAGKLTGRYDPWGRPVVEP
ncbi:YhfX family PLP-dependent enzyme [Streptomyces piniterrae]|uniref:YhfX family PLP-dependent enzyme n=1 Tax=Streptomyces piniterrae TaxID=2571125 RepID=A0A4U0MYQ9_9ACTN|nr:alanine racemase [Streptomyces piniterrae]TJZ46213.1 YhfX family PLP-dependent enzyme [Streptomyces piniterrae]